ncbi:ERMES complex subunit [Marasmius tenuissimus]|nr:ERMES complex subunit [Marasmius tenuissimus]
MSFTFNWPRFSDQFHYDAIQMLNNALNKGNKPPIIADKIEVVELEMGTEPPELEIREIGEMTMDQFRGIFRLSYTGDAHLVLKTKVQANPLNHKQPDIHLMAGNNKGMLAARQPLVVPMLLRLSHFKLRSIVVLVVSKQKGITLVFKTDPLQNVDINSTFDSIAVIQKFIQKEIEGQLRQMFREDLPGIIHRLSQQWVKAKVEAPYLAKRPPPVRGTSVPAPLSFQNVAGVPSLEKVAHRLSHKPSLESGGFHRPPTARSTYSATSRTSVPMSGTRSVPSAPPPTPQEAPESTFPDLENFDPTYGLRPEGLPTKSLFKGFAGQFTPNMGLAELAEEHSEDAETAMYDYDDSSTYDIVDWDGGLGHPAAPRTPTEPGEREHIEYETIPAIGGGSIVRPRTVHSQSLAQFDTSPTLRRNGRMSRSHSSIITSPSRPYTPTSESPSRPSSLFNPYFPESPIGIAASVGLRTPTSYQGSPLPTPQSAPGFVNHLNGRRPITPDSLETKQSYSNSSSNTRLATPPEDESLPIHMKSRRVYSRRSSVSSTGNRSISMSPTHANFADVLTTDIDDPTPKIVLRPSPLNNTLTKFTTLSHSNHTLSPYTRSLEHFTVRSVPPRYLSNSTPSLERQPVKAKRKRTYHIGGKKSSTSTTETTPPPNPPAAPSTSQQSDNDLPGAHPTTSGSDFDVSDMDRYFRAATDTHANPPNLAPYTGSPNIHPRHFRLRTSYVQPE